MKTSSPVSSVWDANEIKDGEWRAARETGEKFDIKMKQTTVIIIIVIISVGLWRPEILLTYEMC